LAQAIRTSYGRYRWVAADMQIPLETKFNPALTWKGELLYGIEWFYGLGLDFWEAKWHPVSEVRVRYLREMPEAESSYDLPKAASALKYLRRVHLPPTVRICQLASGRSASYGRLGDFIVLPEVHRENWERNLRKRWPEVEVDWWWKERGA
jgi:hypothetical protein